MPNRTRRLAGRVRRRVTPLTEFLQQETAGGILLAGASVVALVWANSPWSGSYEDLWHRAVGPETLDLHLDLRHWINDGLMTIFFAVIGLEIKRELVIGELRDRRTVTLPVVAALGGMVLPALLYLLIAGGGEPAQGWGIAMATDVAFVVGVLALLGPRAPTGLKLFLLTLAIVDDIGAILVIAVFYTDELSLGWLAAAAAGFAVVGLLRRAVVASPLAYVPVGIAIWYAMYRSGIHPTIAGVALGLLTPVGQVKGRQVIEELEHRLHPFSSWVVVPLFGLANIGVSLDRDTVSAAIDGTVAWAVAIGLLVGKSVGVTVPALLTARSRLGRLPAGVDRRALAGGGALAGIGFTVSLFIAGLAFDDAALAQQATIGILAGSLASGLVGATTLARSRS